MYKIFADGEAIHNPGLDNPTRLVFGAKISQQANMADSLEFTIYPNNPGAEAIHKLTTVVEVYQDGDLLFRGRPIQSKDGWDNQKTYTCEGGLAFFNDTILRPYEYTGTVRGYLQMLVDQHNGQVPAEKQFTLRTVTVIDPNDNIVRSNTEYTTTMAEIQEKAVGNLGGYLIPTYISGSGWVLDYLAAPAAATGQTITLAKNLLDFLREQNAENIATALIPLGAVDEATGQRITIESVNGGLDYIVDQDAADQYGLIFTTQTWDDVTIPANLLAKAEARLADLATLIPMIQLTAADLSVIDPTIEPIRLLDNVRVQDDAHGASGVYLVTERTYDLSAPENDRVTFGGAVPTISGTSAKTAAAVHDLPARILQTSSDAAREILNAATFGSIQVLYNAETGVAYELRINNSQNPDAATAYWRYNAGGWGYFDGENYTTAATMDGTMFATLIKAGILSSDNGKFYVNLDTGKATLKDVEITGGDIEITGSNQYDGKIYITFTYPAPDGNDYIYTSLLKPGMLTNHHEVHYSGGATTSEEVNVRYDEVAFTKGSDLYSEYQDFAATIRNSAGQSITIVPGDGIKFYENGAANPHKTISWT